MHHCISRRYPHVLIVYQHPLKQVEPFICYHVLVLLVDKTFDTFLWQILKYFLYLFWNCDLVLLDVSVEIICSQDLCNLNKLVFVVFAFKDWVHFEHHASHSASERPHIQRVMVKFIIDQEFRPFIVPRRNSNVVLLTFFVKVCESPIDQSKFIV